MSDRPILIRTGGAVLHVSTCHHARTAEAAGHWSRWAFADGHGSAEIARTITAHALHPCRSCKPVAAVARWEAEQRAAERPTGYPPTPAELLEFERLHPGRDGRKWEIVRRQLDLTPGRYTQLLIAASRSEEGLDADAITAHQIENRIRAGWERRAALTRRRP